MLSGGADQLVNYVHGATDRFVETLRGEEGVGNLGVVDVWVQEGTWVIFLCFWSRGVFKKSYLISHRISFTNSGHKFSNEMVDRANTFLWEHGLRTTGSAKSGARMSERQFFIDDDLVT